MNNSKKTCLHDAATGSPPTNRLVGVFSSHGEHLDTLYLLIQDQVMKMRLVSKGMKTLIETNRFLLVNIRIGDAGVEMMKEKFLLRWHGVLNVYCTKPLQPASPWFQSLTSVLESGRLQNLKMLDLVIEGQALVPLLKTFAGIIQWNRQLSIAIAFRGCGADILAAAAPLAALGGTVTMDICIVSGGDQPLTWLQQLQASNIGVSSISLRFQRPPTNTHRGRLPPLLRLLPTLPADIGDGSVYDGSGADVERRTPVRIQTDLEFKRLVA
jgi:hypothetical protein